MRAVRVVRAVHAIRTVRARRAPRAPHLGPLGLGVLLALLALLLTGTPATAAAPPASAPRAPTGEAAGVVRGGDTLYSSAIRCTVALNATNGSGFYGIMPGRCGIVGTRWFADPQLSIPVGVTVAATFPGSHYSVLRYTNPDLTYPSEVSTPLGPRRIERASQPLIGLSVCQSGRATGWQCGTVTAVNVSVNYPEGTVHGLFRTTLCAAPGESGALTVSGNDAIGILVSGGNCASGGSSFHQPVSEPLSALGLSVGY
ncbi:S1 family peptidase [Streptomyces iconiensis]|uniref:S1 family peptidase n=1 Tax=Streptomyces iconiensis TaxID=1384038 RepID=A0ABT6ZZP3_9ACTN|nr:S1 family peptidase [Streptomyces iconiensis]MDJ1134545.1 S1 family peptidase [Streptomyces iconiensis]